MTTTLRVSREVMQTALGESLLPGFKIDRLGAVRKNHQDGSFEIEIDCAALPPGEVELTYGNYVNTSDALRLYIKEIRRIELTDEAPR